MWNELLLYFCKNPKGREQVKKGKGENISALLTFLYRALTAKKGI